MTHEIENRCSQACTRSGLAALVLAAVAFALLPATDDAIRTNSLRKYLNLRLALVESIKQIETDECWKRLSEERSVASLTLSQASQLECIEETGQADSTYHIQKKTPAIEVPGLTSSSPKGVPIPHSDTKPTSSDTTPPRPPSAPAGLRLSVNYDLPYLDPLNSVLSELARAELLQHAREVSPRYDYAIYRWENFRYKTLLKRSQSLGVHMLSGPIGTADNKTIPKDFTWADFTIGDIIEVASFEMPTLDASDEMERNRPRINIPSVPIPMELQAGASLLLAAMLLVVAFFSLYHHEARRTETYPSEGTLFGVLHHQKGGHVLFIFLTFTPLLSAILLAVKFWSRVSVGSSILNLLIVLLLAVVSLDVARKFKLPKGKITQQQNITIEQQNTSGGESA